MSPSSNALAHAAGVTLRCLGLGLLLALVVLLLLQPGEGAAVFHYERF